MKGFAKTALLAPGESQTLTFDVNNYDLASYHENIHSWLADKGVYTIKFGSSIADIRATGQYTLRNNVTKETNDVLHATRPL